MSTFQASDIETLTNFENLLKTMMEETNNNRLKHETEKFLFELDSLSKQAKAAQKSLLDLYCTLADEPESHDSPIIDSIAKAFSDNFNLNGIPRMRLNIDSDSEVGKSSESDNEDVESLEDAESFEDAESLEDTESFEDAESLADSILTKPTTTTEDPKEYDEEWVEIKTKKKKPSQKLNGSLETNSIASTSSDFSEDIGVGAMEYFGVMTSWTDLGQRESYGKIKCQNFQGKKNVEFFVHVSQLQFKLVAASNLPTVAFQVGHYKNKALNVRLPKIWGN
jgi:hypothetical protein